MVNHITVMQEINRNSVPSRDCSRIAGLVAKPVSKNQTLALETGRGVLRRFAGQRLGLGCHFSAMCAGFCPLEATFTSHELVCRNGPLPALVSGPGVVIPARPARGAECGVWARPELRQNEFVSILVRSRADKCIRKTFGAPAKLKRVPICTYLQGLLEGCVSDAFGGSCEQKSPV